MTEQAQPIRIEVRITGEEDGGERVRVFEAPAGIDVAGILANIATVLPPAFETVTWETSYLP
jgi:hypothetical protein